MAEPNDQKPYGPNQLRAASPKSKRGVANKTNIGMQGAGVAPRPRKPQGVTPGVAKAAGKAIGKAVGAVSGVVGSRYMGGRATTAPSGPSPQPTNYPPPQLQPQERIPSQLRPQQWQQPQPPAPAPAQGAAIPLSQAPATGTSPQINLQPSTAAPASPGTAVPVSLASPPTSGRVMSLGQTGQAPAPATTPVQPPPTVVTQDQPPPMSATVDQLRANNTAATATTTPQGAPQNMEQLYRQNTTEQQRDALHDTRRSVGDQPGVPPEIAELNRSIASEQAKQDVYRSVRDPQHAEKMASADRILNMGEAPMANHVANVRRKMMQPDGMGTPGEFDAMRDRAARREQAEADQWGEGVEEAQRRKRSMAQGIDPNTGEATPVNYTPFGKQPNENTPGPQQQEMYDAHGNRFTGTYYKNPVTGAEFQERSQADLAAMNSEQRAAYHQSKGNLPTNHPLYLKSSSPGTQERREATVAQGREERLAEHARRPLKEGARRASRVAGRLITPEEYSRSLGEESITERARRGEEVSEDLVMSTRGATEAGKTKSAQERRARRRATEASTAHERKAEQSRLGREHGLATIGAKGDEARRTADTLTEGDLRRISAEGEGEIDKITAQAQANKDLNEQEHGLGMKRDEQQSKFNQDTLRLEHELQEKFSQSEHGREIERGNQAFEQQIKGLTTEQKLALKQSRDQAVLAKSEELYSQMVERGEAVEGNEAEKILEARKLAMLFVDGGQAGGAPSVQPTRPAQQGVEALSRRIKTLSRGREVGRLGLDPGMDVGDVAKKLENAPGGYSPGDMQKVRDWIQAAMATKTPKEREKFSKHPSIKFLLAGGSFTDRRDFKRKAKSYARYDSYFRDKASYRGRKMTPESKASWLKEQLGIDKDLLAATRG